MSGEAENGGGYSFQRAALVIGGILLARLVALWFNRTELFFDESQYWAWSTAPDWGYYSKPPLIAWIIALSTKVCGDGEACIRLPAVALHAVTALLVYVLGRRLYSARTGFWSALAYATLPGVSVSSGIISTDVPLLLTWALALIGFAGLVGAAVEAPGAKALPPRFASVVLGLGLGLGLNAKYAMAYAVLSAALYFWLEPAARPVLRKPWLWIALALGILCIVPNLVWNAHHSFATFSHTADNAKWEGGDHFNIGKAAEFLGAQFGVFGPVLFGTLLAFLWRAVRARAETRPADRLLLAFSLPIIAIVTAQAFISRAHPNWAAVAYVPAVVLVTDYMLRSGAVRWAKGSLALNGMLAVLIALGSAMAGLAALPGFAGPFDRMMGNTDLAAAVRAEIAARAKEGRPYAAILADDREITASLLYYAREEKTPLYAWRAGAKPHDHFELTRPFTGKSGEPVLLVTHKADVSDVTNAFAAKEDRGGLTIPPGRAGGRKYAFIALSGYRSP